MKRLGEESIRDIVENVLATHMHSRDNIIYLWLLVLDRFFDVYVVCNLCNQKCKIPVKLCALKTRDRKPLYNSVQSSPLTFHAIYRNAKKVQNTEGLYPPSDTVKKGRVKADLRIKKEFS